MGTPVTPHCMLRSAQRDRIAEQYDSAFLWIGAEHPPASWNRAEARAAAGGKPASSSARNTSEPEATRGQIHHRTQLFQRIAGRWRPKVDRRAQSPEPLIRPPDPPSPPPPPRTSANQTSTRRHQRLFEASMGRRWHDHDTKSAVRLHGDMRGRRETR